MQTTIKRVDEGLVSNYMIDHFHKGDSILSQAPLGQFFTLPKTLDKQKYILFSAGIGITPLFSILKSVLESSQQDEVYLIYSSRDKENIIYRSALKVAKNKYKEQLKIIYILSKTQGRLNENKLSELMAKFNVIKDLFYICGPKPYMDMIMHFLVKHKVLKDQIFIEDFKIFPVLGPKPDRYSVIFQTAKALEGEPKKLQAKVNDEVVTIPLNRETSLLEQLIEKGVDVPFSCASGSCMTCMAKLKQGKVFQLDEAILDEDNIKDLELLTCQSYPLSETVYVDFDDI